MVSWIRWQGRKPDRPGRPKRGVRVCWEHLAEDPVKMVFNSHLRRSFNHIPEVAGNMESEWAMFRAAIAEVAAQSCSSKIAGTGRGGNPRTHWWTPEVKSIVTLQKETHKPWLAADSFQQAKQSTARVVTEKITWV